MSASALLFALVVAVQASGSGAQNAPPPADAECLACHSDTTLTMTLSDGTLKSMHADAASLAHSRHAGKALCVDCHPGTGDASHPNRTFAYARQLTVAMSEN